MAIDEAMLESAAAEGQCTLRFYQWEEPTLSLGYFQLYADRWQHAASSRATVVRRLSGGGAILHDRELTYSLAVPTGHPLARDRLQLYAFIHICLIEALASWGIAARMVDRPGEKRSPNGSPAAAPFLCFQRRTPGDVLVNGAKIAGSAQRRCRGAVLQHGSVLLARSPAAPELDGLQELKGKTLLADQLLDAWCEKLAGTLPITLRRGKLPEGPTRRAVRLAAEKYALPAWTEKWRKSPL